MHEMGARKVELSELFETSDVVTLHSPWLKETEGMITGELLSSLKPNATFINTSRGALVREKELINVLGKRPDIMAILDVTHPEPPVIGSPLYRLDNVVLTPHIAGAMGDEVLRLADLAIEEFACWIAGRPLRYAITREALDKIA
jgi:phosphoglycerate dehydrogenase-like enzyme